MFSNGGWDISFILSILVVTGGNDYLEMTVGPGHSSTRMDVICVGRSKKKTNKIVFIYRKEISKVGYKN